jgi:cation transport protein ChaC
MWVFGYGSLMWDEWEKKFDGKRYDNSKILNYHRDFNKKSTVNWGTGQNPGPTLGLEVQPGSECIGCAFEFPDEKREQILGYLKDREGESFSLPEIDVILENGTAVKAFTPINSHTSHTYIGGLNINQRVQMAKSAVGSHGKCTDYVSSIRNKLVELNIQDEHVEIFWKALS